MKPYDKSNHSQLNTVRNPIERDFGNLLHRRRGHSCRFGFLVPDSEPSVKERQGAVRVQDGCQD